MKNNIKYSSTRGKSVELLFKDVIFEGLAPDGGLYVPETWPKLEKETLSRFSGMSYQQIAFEVISPYIDSSLSDDDLKNIIDKAYSSFDHPEITPLNKINDNKYLLELFHGPTYAFKDVAMQFISQLMGFYLKQEDRSLNILGATSGDTGAAAIESFKNIKSVKIFILHPYNKISEVQRKFMTTIKSDNVFNIAVKGSFDDCQNIIKQIFSDQSYKKNNNLTAINSINWARIMCQIVYYFYTISRLKTTGKRVLFSVPTGNFGDILAGYIALKMGLDIDMLNIATNENDILTRTLTSGEHELRKVKETTSPSIDIQISSNFERLLFDISKDTEYVNKLMSELKKTGTYTLSNDIIDQIKNHFCSYSVSEDEVNRTISEIYENHNIILDPHTAVGFASAGKCPENYDLSITLSTAHPAKFKDTVEKLISNDSFVTEKVKKLMQSDEQMIILENNATVVQDFISNNM